MSLWPIVAIECNDCHSRKSVFDYDLDTCSGDDDQKRFFRLLWWSGWDTCHEAKDYEADDDGLVWGYCPACTLQHEESRQRVKRWQDRFKVRYWRTA